MSDLNGAMNETSAKERADLDWWVRRAQRFEAVIREAIAAGPEEGGWLLEDALAGPAEPPKPKPRPCCTGHARGIGHDGWCDRRFSRSAGS